MAMVARSLRHRNFQLYFAGQGISVTGTWMQRTAISWLVYRLTDSELALGVVGFASHFFTFLLAPFAGVLSDRINRRSLIVLTQGLAMVQAFVLAALTIKGIITVPHIIILSAVLSLVEAFDTPVRQAFVVEMVDSREDLPNAIAMNSFLFNAARLVGPSLAGLMIWWTNEGICFLLNAVSFVAVLFSLLAMKLRPFVKKANQPAILHNLKEGFVYAFGFMPIRSILLLLSLYSLLGLSYRTLMPVVARNVLHGGPETMGFLMSATGVGAVIGALLMASRQSVRDFGRAIAGASMLFSVSLICFSFSSILSFSLMLMVVVGFAGMVQMVSCNTLLQTLVDDDKRGRVMSFYTMSLLGVAPFGNLITGALASGFGARWAMALSGVGCAISAAFFAFRLPRFTKCVNPIYIEKGIMPATPPEDGDGALPIEQIEKTKS